MAHKAALPVQLTELRENPVKSIAIAWEVGVESGWGTYGMNLAIETQRRGVKPELYFVSSSLTLDPLRRRLIAQPLARASLNRRLLDLQGNVESRGPVLHALGDDLDIPSYGAGLHGAPDVGVVFFENGTLSPQAVEAGERLPLIIAGSSWNLQVMQRHGLNNVALCLQGIDRSLFHPARTEKLFADRFVVFSGGKLEYRKGQDLVVAAFKIFQQRHPDALLMTAWANLWPEGLSGLHRSPHVDGIPEIRADRSLAVDGWLMANGLPAHSFVDLGGMPNLQVPQVLRQADVGLFPNRCEGGTNLVAMEAMACGLPVILSNNTGHMDLIAEVDGAPTCWPLNMQIPLSELTGDPFYSDWGESAVEEIIARLEDAYSNRQDASERGAAAARFMEDWSWSARVGQLLDAVDAVTP
jgi:glycosyltransferase involved in cell wall biosynthesis